MQQENQQKQKVICVHCRGEVTPADNRVEYFMVGPFHTLCWVDWDEEYFFKMDLIERKKF